MEKQSLLHGVGIRMQDSLTLSQMRRHRSHRQRPVLERTKSCLCRNNCPCIPARFVLAGMLFLAFLIMYALRINMSVAIVAMVNSSYVSGDASKPGDGSTNGTSSQCTPTAPVFFWSGTEQAWILSSFFYGYTLSQIPGGYLSTRFSSKHTLGFGILIPAILTLFTPLAALSNSIVPIVILRVFEGLFQGLVFPSKGAIIGHWAPPFERSRWIAVCDAGSYIGAIFAFPLTGLLCQCGYAGGWPSAFYTFGIAGIVWYIAWLFLVYDSPSSHPRISQKEVIYIQTALQNQNKGKPGSVPWLPMLTSWSFWAIVVAFICNDWGFYTLLTGLPTYLKQTLPDRVDFTKDGLLAGIPYASMAVVSIAVSFLTDFIISKGFPVVLIRKINTGLGMTLPAIFLIMCGYLGSSLPVAVVLIALALGGEGFNVAGFGANALDIAPRYAGIIIGIANTGASATGIVAPQIIKLLTTSKVVAELRLQWRTVFIVAAQIFFFGGIIFAVLASGEVQPWAKPKNSESRKKESSLVVNVNGDLINEKQPSLLVSDDKDNVLENSTVSIPLD